MLQVVEGNSPYGAQLITDAPIARGELFFRIEQCRHVQEPTYQTIQTGVHDHVEELGVLAYLNHSCRPNVLVHTGKMACFAARDIAAGEELSFFYPSTEWEMARPFLCLCGAPECIRLVTGARHIPLDMLSRYFINDHIRQMVQEALEATAKEFFQRESLATR
jgi:hypothetical protein